MNPIDRIGVRRPGVGERQIKLLPPGEISYLFLGSAAPPEVLAICIRNDWRLEPHRVYARTAKGIYWTRHRRLVAISRELAELRLFFPVGRTRLVNPLKIAALDATGRPPLLVFVTADGQKEILTVARRAWPALRDRLRV